MIQSVVFDIDGTLLDTEHADLEASRDTLRELGHEVPSAAELRYTLGIPGNVALRQMGIADVEEGGRIWHKHFEKYTGTIRLFEGIETVVKELKSQGYGLGIITSKTRAEYEHDFVRFGLDGYFDVVICSDDTVHPKPAPDPMLRYLELSGAKPAETLYVGDSTYDRACAASADVAFGLAVWGAHSVENRPAEYYFNAPRDIPYLLSLDRNRQPDEVSWLNLAMELQFIGQAGITYSRDPFDRERFERIRELSAEIMSRGTGYPQEHVKEVFCNETGFQTPKLDTRAAIFRKNKILLVKERNGTWSLPGGWVDVNESIRSNTIKEVREEAGLEVIPVRLIAVQDRELHNRPVYAYGVTKAFVLCQVVGGGFTANTETTESRYFGLDELPLLAEEKNTAAQIRLCFEAYRTQQWEAVFD